MSLPALGMLNGKIDWPLDISDWYQQGDHASGVLNADRGMSPVTDAWRPVQVRRDAHPPPPPHHPLPCCPRNLPTLVHPDLPLLLSIITRLYSHQTLFHLLFERHIIIVQNTCRSSQFSLARFCILRLSLSEGSVAASPGD
jgi:hypothetical protein